MNTRFKMLASLLFSAVLALSVTTTALAQEDLSSQGVFELIELGSPEDANQNQEIQIVTDDLDAGLTDEVVVVQDQAEPDVEIQNDGNQGGGDVVKSVTDNPVTQGANLTKATQKYGLQNAVVIEATTVAEIDEALSIAKKHTTVQTPYVVHVPAGTYAINQISVTPNVFFVAESNASFAFVAGDKDNSMVNVSGVLFGGSYDGKKAAKNVLYFGKKDFQATDGTNGVIESATVTNAVRNGILANDSTCKNGKVIDCKVTNCLQNGISVERGASLSLISGCNTSNNGYSATLYSGINLSLSDVGTIENCVIENNADKAVSTYSDQAGQPQIGCTIGAITGCTMRGNKVNGVYIKPYCTLKSFKNNLLEANGDGLVCTGKTQQGTGKAVASNVVGNTFKNNKNGNLTAAHPGASISVGSNNTFIGSGKATSSLIAKDGGAITIGGSKVTITSAKAAGISVTGKKSKCTISSTGISITKCATQGIYCSEGSLTISGKNAKLASNKKEGIYIKSKGTVTIKGASAVVTGSKSAGVYVGGGSTFTVTGKGFKIQQSGGFGLHVKAAVAKITGKGAIIEKSKKAGVALYDKAVFNMTGKSSQIRKNGDFGIYATTKSKAKVRNVKFVSNKKGKTYTTNGAKITK